MARIIKSLILFTVLIGLCFAFFEKEMKGFLHFQEKTAEQRFAEFRGQVGIVTAAQLDAALQAVTVKEQKTLVIYMFDTKCPACSIHLQEVNDYGFSFNKKDLYVMAVAINETPDTLAQFLATHLRGLSIRPYVISPQEHNRLLNFLRKRGSTYAGKVPYIAVVDTSGYFLRLPPGLNRDNKFRGEIERAIERAGK